MNYSETVITVKEIYLFFLLFKSKLELDSNFYYSYNILFFKKKLITLFAVSVTELLMQIFMAGMESISIITFELSSVSF